MTVTLLKQKVIEVYDRVAGDFADDPLTQGVGQQLVDFVPPGPGHHVLDVGCGRGAVLFRAADLVGTGGRAVGIDLARRMVDCTAEEIAVRGWRHVEVRLDEGERPDFPSGSFDLVLSSMVMHFMEDPLGALRRYRELLRPAGRFGVAEFAGGDDRWMPAMSVLVEFVNPADLPENPEIPPAVQLLLSADTLCAALTGAGFVEPEVREVVQEVVFDDPAQWWQWTRIHGVQTLIQHIPADRMATARAAVSAELERIRDSDGRLRYRLPVRMARATRPSDAAT